MRKTLFIYMLLAIYFVLNISGCGMADRKAQKYVIEEKADLSSAADNINKVQLHNGVGDIHIEPYDGDKIMINLKKSIRGNNKKEMQDICKDIKIQAIDTQGTLEIKTLYKQNDLWKSEYSSDKYDISMDYTLKVPKHVMQYSIKSAVGDIYMDNIEGQLEVTADVGGIQAANIMLHQNSQFKTDTGEINLTIASILNTKNVDIAADIGDIQLSIPEDVECQLDISEYMKEKQFIGNKGPLITVKAALGDIIIRRPSK